MDKVDKVDNDLLLKNSPKVACNYCNYICCHYFDYVKYYNTLKLTRITRITKNSPRIKSEFKFNL